jgi:hypothetical protein
LKWYTFIYSCNISQRPLLTLLSWILVSCEW